MTRLIHNYPIVSVALLLLACIHFEYNATTWSITIPGLVAGLVVLAIISVILLFRIFNAAHEACLKRGLISERLKFRYDALIPIAILAVMVSGNWQGGMVQGMGRQQVPHWIFAWSDSAMAAPFIGAVIGFVLLQRIFVLVKTIAAQPPNSAPLGKS